MVACSGVRKAAALLMSLDASTAAALLKSAEPGTLKQIVAEVAYLIQTGQRASSEAVREFLTLLQSGRRQSDPVMQLLEMALGEQAHNVHREVQDLLAMKDPFGQVRSASVEHIAQALDGESPQVIALVLAELPTRKATDLLAAVEEARRAQAVGLMAGGGELSDVVRLKVARALRTKLDAIARKAAQQQDAAGATEQAAAPMSPQQKQHRKVAQVLRGLPADTRGVLLKALAQRSEETAKGVQQMMVLWQDLPIIGDRAVQESLRSVDSRKLALALVGADEPTKAKVRANISERAAAMLDEESSLLSSPKPADVEQSRELILAALRKINDSGELTFEES
ncbi:MAG: FliG C-terminal domain-containing protein [Planctomycetaceae bacterium]|nr:hypothetical protein [Planctomycetaceae bacterium]